MKKGLAPVRKNVVLRRNRLKYIMNEEKPLLVAFLIFINHLNSSIWNPSKDHLEFLEN